MPATTTVPFACDNCGQAPISPFDDGFARDGLRVCSACLVEFWADEAVAR